MSFERSGSSADGGAVRPRRRSRLTTSRHMPSTTARRALVVGATGISGGNVAARLLDDGWDVVGLCRRPNGLDPRVSALSADLEDAAVVAAVLKGSGPTHVFFTTWSRRSTEA